MYSLWEKQSFLTADVLIIGAGITGLSAAASLKEKEPTLDVVVLERGILPTGASTKNAGFACFGSVSELLNDVESIGEIAMTELVQRRWNGLQKTKQRLGEKAIDLQMKSGYELLFEEESSIIHQIEKINKLLQPLFNEKVFEVTNSKIQAFNFGNTHHLIENKLEGQLDTGKLISSLWKYCSSLGIRVHTGCEVISIQEEENSVKVMTKEAIFSSKKVGVCTNAFTKNLMPDELDILPGRGIVMSIVPEKSLSFEGTFHYDDGYYYFRDYYGKLLFGGGRNLALEEEETTEFGVNQKIKQKLIADLDSIILPNKSYEIELEWSGIMAFGKTKQPIVKKVSDRIAMGVRLGGMGVAIGSLVGEEVAELLS
jgi:glycine/D-amino acid oxidase-like deaminating enzyme